MCQTLQLTAVHPKNLQKGGEQGINQDNDIIRTGLVATISYYRFAVPCVHNTPYFQPTTK